MSVSGKVEALKGVMLRGEKCAEGKEKAKKVLPNKRNRKGAPKVKTGCLTCRIRRVKCDEGKPMCQRCNQFGAVCDGYRKPEGKVKNSSQTAARQLVPKIEMGSNAVQLLREILPGPEFKDDRELRYFRYFCDDTAESLTGPFKTALWLRSIPQASEMKPFIRCATVALGALSLSKSGPENDGPGSSEGQQITCAHEAYATTQYIKALQGMRKALTEKPDDIRQILIACLLVFCFESLQGNQVSACVHASGGLELVNRISRVLDCPRNGDRDYPNGLLKKIGVEEDLYTAFSGLDIQTLHSVDTRSEATHRILKEEVSKEVDNMPAVLEDIQEATRYWKLIMQRTCHFVATARAEVIALSSARDNPKHGDSESIPLRPGNNLWSNAQLDPVPAPPHLLAEQQQCFADIKRFEKAAETVFAQYTSPEDGDGYCMSLVIKIQIAMNTINLGYCFFPPAMEWDDYLPTFRSVVELFPLVSPFLKRRPPSARSFNGLLFRFEIGVIPALSLTAIFCRTQPERDRALEMLKRLGNYREGLWDATTLYFISKWLRDVEEGWRDQDGHIPVNRRVKFESGDVNLRKRRLVIRGWQGDGTEKGMYLREGVVEW